MAMLKKGNNRDNEKLDPTKNRASRRRIYVVPSVYWRKTTEPVKERREVYKDVFVDLDAAGGVVGVEAL